jgi:hemerythrin
MEHRKPARKATPDSTTGDIEPFPWLPVLEMGNEEIDRDHREAVEEGNHLIRLLNARNSWAETVELLRQARDRSARPFANEDKILKRAGFPGAGAHRRILVELNAIVAELEIVTDPQPHHWERAHAPRNLLVDHCLQDDLKFKSHLEHVSQAHVGLARRGPAPAKRK